MQKRALCHIHLRFFLFFYFSLFFPFCESMEDLLIDNENTFYAISSLCSHIDGLIPEETEANSNEERILFEDAEVAILWGEAYNSSFISQITKTQHYYYQAKDKKDRPPLANQLYAKSKSLLSKVWTKLDTKLLAESVPENMVNYFPNYSKTLTYPYLTYPHLENNARINNKMAKIITPYLLPVDHPIKESLDQIFETSRAIKDKKSFEAAGFTTLFYQKIHSYIRVAKHAEIPGYLFKVYLDSETNKRAKKGWEYLKNRCEGAANVRQLIKSKNIKHFTVADKWLYILPPNTPTTNKDQPVVLVVTDMNLVSDSKTEEAWQTKVTHEHLDELYCIISHGYGSSGLTRNVPYTKDGFFTFIDTEKPNKTPNYDKARHYLSHEMRTYWDILVRTGGKGKGGSKKKK